MGRKRKDFGSLSPELPLEDRLLLALRAGPIDSHQLAERFGSAHGVYALVRRGLATANDAGVGSVYRITQAGRAVCPSRSELLRRPA